jgi:2-polyprenyl-6-methoxyphenol hydroxylase-like FAD-dependent oxidoreductase
LSGSRPPLPALRPTSPAAARNTPAADVIRTDLHDVLPVRQGWQRRVGLLGDAAHAMTPNLGQGGAQADRLARLGY